MRILVVEDEATVAQAIEALLTNHHYAVDTVADGLAGLDMAEAYHYDLMLLDIGLPEMDGVSLCRKLRHRGMQAPILLLTGQATEAHAKATALNAGADDYVTKPFDAEELLARIQSLLRRGALKAPPVLRWGALALDPNHLQVSYKETLLHLTPKEYSLLEILLRHAPNIVSAYTILEQCWNALEVPSDETVRTHIKELRKKLKAAGTPDDFIKTVHRQGYRLNPLYGETAFPSADKPSSVLQMAELRAANQELRNTLKQLQDTHGALQEKNQELANTQKSLIYQQEQLRKNCVELMQQVRERNNKLTRVNHTLEQQKSQWHALFNYALEAIVVVDDQGRYLDANPAACQLFGMPREDLLSYSIADFADPAVDVAAVWRQFLEQGQMSGEFRLQLPDGQVRDTEFNAIANYVPGQHLSVLRDISERQRAAATLRQSEEQLRLFVAASSDVIYRMSADWQELRCLEGKDFLASTDDPSHTWLETYIPPEEQSRVRAAIQDAIRTRSFFELEHQIIRRNGSIGWTFSRAIPLLNEQGDLVEWFGAASDITSRKRAEAALYESQAQLSRIFDNVGAAIGEFVVFPDRTYIHGFYSIGCETVFGYSQVEMIGDNELWQSRVVPEDMEAVIMPAYEQIFAENSFTIEYRFRDTTDTIRWINETLTSQWDEVAGCWRVTTVGVDISDRKRAELALQQKIRQEQLLADIAQDIRQSLELKQVLSRTVERVRGLLDCDRVIIFRFSPDWQGQVIMESVGKGLTPILSTTIVDPCFEDRFIEPYRQGHVSVLSDIDQPGLEPCYVELLQQFQIKASLAVPILQGDDLWGLLIAHQCLAPRHWEPTEITLLQRLAIQVGIASQQSELFEKTRNELAARRAMQKILEESEARFRSLSASAPIGICQTNADGICLYVNPHWCEISGMSLADCLGDGWLQGVHPDDRKMLATAWENYLQGGSDRLPEFRLLTPEGTIRWISARVAAIKSIDGEIIGYVSTDTDITERKQTEQALRDSEQRLQAILDHSPASIYLLDHQNRHLLVNHSYAAMLSTTPDQLIGKRLHEVWPTEFADQFVTQNRTILETGQLLQIEDTAPLADGIHSYITVKFPLYDATGNPYALCGISTDVTENKRLEAQFYQAQRLESLGTLAGGIAHDLNNVLTPILAVAQMLQLTQRGLDAKGLEQLKLLETSAKRGANLVKQILTVTRASEGERIPVDLVTLIRDEIEIIRQSFPKSIQIKADVPALADNPPALGRILADPTHLHQILMNLCINARDAMPHGGTLTIAAETVFVDEVMAAHTLDAQANHYAVITVADTGTGIPPHVQDRMYDPFFTTKSPGEGTGLGLATVRGLVKANEGFIQAFSEVNQGTQFKVYFPLVEGDADEPNQSSDWASQLAPRHHEALVLVVEDEEMVRSLLRSLLESHHYRTLLAQDGAEALEQYQQHAAEIQLVVTDIMMPNMNGFTLMRRLKALNPQMHIIALSGVASHEATALAAGADYFVAKPFELESLLSQVSTLLEAAASAKN